MKWLLVVLVAIVWPGATAWALSVTPERGGAAAEPLPDLAADITWLHRARVQPASVATLATTTTTVVPSTTSTAWTCEPAACHTTPPPTARAAAPRPPPRASGDGCGGWRPLVATYGWDVDHACRILLCESGGNANAVGPSTRYGHAQGLMQILPGGSFDPATNMAQAFAKYQARGWAPWVCR